MSDWTDILIGATSIEDTNTGSGRTPICPAIDFLNEHLAPFSLFKIENPDPERQTPRYCFAAHVKNLGWDRFKEVVDAAPWRWREQIFVFMRQEDDLGFVIYRPAPL